MIKYNIKNLCSIYRYKWNNDKMYILLYYFIALLIHSLLNNNVVH